MRRLIVAVSLLAFVSGISSAQERQVVAERIGNRIDVTIGDDFFTSYRFEDDEKYPFFFPVNGPASGGSVTSMRNGMYPHHSSLFFGCDYVNGGNYWQEGLDRGRIISVGARVIESGGNMAVIEDECIWKRPDAEAPIIDRRRISICSPDDGLYQIDFDIEMEMLMDVTIGKTNHSLFSARIATDLTVPQGGHMVNSRGGKGEKETFGVESEWLDFYGKRKTGVEGIAILQHPGNPGFPSKWFTRDYGFMSPTPMFWPEDDRATYYRKGDKVRLRYRVLVHKGCPKDAKIDELFKQYANE
ncbi:MAG: PmoA family protein [Bacteroidales bacterium]|nr:PmoA family protein [Candidatus Cryptobacteroides choladohippi]MCQ2179915.1 PmoA family protein [Bacteroidales bacterium]